MIVFLFNLYLAVLRYFSFVDCKGFVGMTPEIPKISLVNIISLNGRGIAIQIYVRLYTDRIRKNPRIG